MASDGPRPGGPTHDPYQPPRSEAAPGEEVSRRATLGDIFSNYPLALRRSWSTVAGPYLILQGVALVLVLAPTLAVQYLQTRTLLSGEGTTEGVLAGALLFLVAQLLIVCLSLVIGTVQLGLAKALRIAMVEGPAAVGGTGGAFRLAFGRFWHVLANALLVGIAMVVSLILCILPILAAIFFLMLAPYLVAACDEGPWEGIVRGVRLTVRNVGTLVILTAISLAFGIIYYVVAWALGLALLSAVGLAYGQIVAQGILSVVTIPVAYLVWIFYQAAFVTIETTDGGVPIAR